MEDLSLTSQTNRDPQRPEMDRKTMVIYTPSKPGHRKTIPQSKEAGRVKDATWPYPPPSLRPVHLQVTHRSPGDLEGRTIKPLPNKSQPLPPSESKSQPSGSESPKSSGHALVHEVPTNPFPSPPKSPYNPSLGPQNHGDTTSPSKRKEAENALQSTKRQRKESEGYVGDIGEMGDAESKRNDVQRHAEHKAYLKRQVKEGNARIYVLTQRNKEQIEIQRDLEEKLKLAEAHRKDIVTECLDLKAQVQGASSEISRWASLAEAWKRKAEDRDKRVNANHVTIAELKKKERALLDQISKSTQDDAINRSQEKGGPSETLSKERDFWSDRSREDKATIENLQAIKKELEATIEVFRERENDLMAQRNSWAHKARENLAEVQKLESELASALLKTSEDEKTMKDMMNNFRLQLNTLTQTVMTDNPTTQTTVMTDNPTTQTPSNANGPTAGQPSKPTTEPSSGESRPSSGEERSDAHELDGDGTNDLGAQKTGQTEAVQALLLQRRIRKENMERNRRGRPTGGVGPKASSGLPVRKAGPSSHNGRDEDMDTDETEPYGEGVESEGDGDQGTSRETKPVSRKSVEDIARNVVQEELNKSSDIRSAGKKPNRKTVALDEEKRTISKDQRKWYCSLARDVLRVAFNVTSVEDFAVYVPPKQEVINSYVTSSAPESGPNKEILADLAEERRRNDEEYQWLPKRSSQYMGELFKSLLERARVAFNNAQQKFKDNGEIETLEEAEERMVNQKEKSLKEVRVNTRRQAKYDRRLKSAVQMSNEAVPGSEEAALGQFKRKAIEDLGPDGMSSDDSCVENGREFFVARRMPERRNVDGLVKSLDDYHGLQKKASAKRGAKLGTRIRTQHGPMSRRRPFVGKSEHCYSTAWLRQQSKSQIEGLKIKKNTFNWIDLGA